MHTLYKTDGTEVKVNDTSLDYALSLGWSTKKPTKAKVEKPTKAKVD